MTKFAFLTPEWVAEAEKIRDEFAGQAKPAPKIRMNQIITEVPFGDGVVNVHTDSSDGTMKMGLGHLDAPELTLTVDYATAKALIVDNNTAAAMQAFMSGKIKVQGDMTKLMAMQAGGADPTAAEVAKRIQEITE